MKSFEDRVAVVTGAASGIGRALAKRFAAEGMRVVVADIDATRLSDIVNAIRQSGATVIAVPTDVSRSEDVEMLAERTMEEFGGVHILCNNAGMGGETPVYTFKRVKRTGKKAAK